MESTEVDPDIRNDIVQPPSYAEAIRTPVPLPLPPYRPVELRSRSPPPPYSEVIGQIIHENNSPIPAQPIRCAYQSLVANESGRRARHSRYSSGRSRNRHPPTWRTVELQIPRTSTDAAENLLQQVRRPPGSLPQLRLLRPPLQDPRPLRNGFPTVNNKKVIHILAGGLGLLIPLGVIIAMATKETPPEIETSTQLLSTPSIFYMKGPGVNVDSVHGDNFPLDRADNVRFKPFRRKRRTV
ncbi:uncharacterized protein LOC124127404 [Haliotis rufescens]|uniref:uncharacterized protein LOC124127404 n=1 Tax=Haliotis rufescens TaxID=6454 RepID=UPI001EB04F3A|nr:uncharacterized protein LOC124127404 [Haliotis rufescens]XP_048237008.1 uncharacterized protein LOC124127404 [Haliotis rufescens]